MTLNQQSTSLAELTQPYAIRAKAAIERWLIEPGCPPELAEAMRYSALGGGKFLRPVLVLMAAEACGADDGQELALRAAAAAEMIHCYSLVHDDLPAMDDDVLRRGRPTLHVKFGQAMAILAGDALLTRAFATIAEAGGSAAAEDTVGHVLAELALASGQAGMIAGQVADMELCSVADGIEGLRYIHQRKTGALIRACARVGGLCANASSEKLDCLSRYGELLGLAFQVTDDILDVVGTADGIGKTPGKDAVSGKRTYVSLMGLESARAFGQELAGRATAAAEALGDSGGNLAMLARLLAQRTR